MYTPSTSGYHTAGHTSSAYATAQQNAYAQTAQPYDVQQPTPVTDALQTAPARQSHYTFSDSQKKYELPPAIRHQDVHTSFLAADRPQTQFIGHAAQVRTWIEEAFEKLVGEKFPKNLRVIIGSEDDIRAHHHGTWSRGILGFSLNRQGVGTSEIYIKENNLDILMLTIGHEIGHVMSPTLPSPHDEEAKAFAFELAWVNTLITHNIAGLAECFHPEPAHNGLHDVAYRFVRHIIEQGTSAIDVFANLVFGRLSMMKTLEWRVK